MDFMKSLEDLGGVIIPLHIKNVLILNNCANHIAFRKLTLENLKKIEDLVRKQFFKIIPNDADKKNYYGIFFKDDPENFQFLEGDIILILELVKMFEESYHLTRHESNTETTKAKCVFVESPNIYDVVSAEESTLLRMLIESARNRAITEDKRGLRYNDVLKLFSAYIFMVGGPILYDTLRMNLPLPSRSSISRVIHNTKPVVEGVCRTSELNSHLEKNNLPRKVWISEDATRCTGKVQYNSKTNELIGLVLPKDENSMPIACSFLATSLEAIVNLHDENSLSSLIYVYMAQPLTKDAPAFFIAIFGTDNKFSANDSLKRLNYIFTCLEEQGIEVWGVSSDGDPRLLRTHRIQSDLGLLSPDFSRLCRNLPSNFFLGFHAKVIPEHVPVQDPTHIAGTLRNRVLKPSILLPIGKFVVSSAHVEILLDLLPRDKHLLTEKDFSPKDKMNFASVLRLCDPRVQMLLEENNPASKATQKYLQLMHYVTHSYLSKDLGILDRLYFIWYSVFFLRYWRAWLNENPDYSITDNFITLNTYLCIEINAHGLLNIIFKCLKNDDFSFFLPWYFGSQSCESFFRMLRSLSTSYSTIVNCSVLEALHKIRRIELQEYISVFNYKKVDENLFFPRTKHLHAHYEELSKVSKSSKERSTISSEVYFDDQVPISFETLNDALKKAKNDAFITISGLGVQIDPFVADHLDTTQINIDNSETNGNNEDDSNLEIYDDEDEDEDEEFDRASDTMSNESEENELMEFDSSEILERDDSPFLIKKCSNGENEIIRKSAIVWQLNKSSNKLSSDRLVRVRESELMTFKKNPVDSNKRCDRIHVGDWCLFQRIDCNKCLIGFVLNFIYPEGTTWRSSEYSAKYANIEGNKRVINVMCDWFSVNNDRILELVDSYSRGYIAISNYKFTIIPPLINDGKFVLSNDTHIFLREIV